MWNEVELGDQKNLKVRDVIYERFLTWLWLFQILRRKSPHRGHEREELGLPHVGAGFGWYRQLRDRDEQQVRTFKGYVCPSKSNWVLIKYSYADVKIVISLLLLLSLLLMLLLLLLITTFTSAVVTRFQIW